MASLPKPTAARLPRWRGFNLLEKYSLKQGNRPFLEADFQRISEWGFNFVRLPLDYRVWANDGDWGRVNEISFKEIDQALEWGRKYQIHVCVNFHRSPGWCINPPQEPKSLWADKEAQDACATHWAYFAQRYRGIPNGEVSFDLFNEPNEVNASTYARVVQVMVEAIRQKDPKRLIIVDGIEVGTVPVPQLHALGVAQATRGYQPMEISHYHAPWFKEGMDYPLPDWPMEKGGEIYDKAWLKRHWVDPWKTLEIRGTGVFVGEWGAYRETPHPVVLAWMGDQLELWKEAGWGWALWNFRGDFGPLDSHRKDVRYQEFRGHLLDQKMLDLLQKF